MYHKSLFFKKSFSPEPKVISKNLTFGILKEAFAKSTSCDQYVFLYIDL
jgi:hypothetical protein